MDIKREKRIESEWYEAAKWLKVVVLHIMGILDTVMHHWPNQTTGFLSKVNPIIHEEVHPERLLAQEQHKRVKRVASHNTLQGTAKQAVC